MVYCVECDVVLNFQLPISVLSFEVRFILFGSNPLLSWFFPRPRTSSVSLFELFHGTASTAAEAQLSRDVCCNDR